MASVTIRQASVDSFKNTVAKNMMHMRMINLTFAIIIALGVVYNGARISLSERSRELATLRVIGFTRREISTILLGEIGTITLLGIPFGLVMGYWFAWMLTFFLDQEVFRFPFVISQFDVRPGGRRRCWRRRSARRCWCDGSWTTRPDRGPEIERMNEYEHDAQSRRYRMLLTSCSGLNSSA